MRNLVIIIEAILFLIFIGYTGLGIETAMQIEDNIPLQRGVFTFFCSVILLTFVVAFFTIRKTIKLFDGNTLGVIEFIKNKIKQDNKFILLIWLIIIEIALTLFWLIVLSLMVYLIIGFNTDNSFWGSQEIMFDMIWTEWGTYFAFLCASYFVLRKFLKAFLKNCFIFSYIRNAIIVLICQIIILIAYMT